MLSPAVSNSARRWFTMAWFSITNSPQLILQATRFAEFASALA